MENIYVDVVMEALQIQRLGNTGGRASDQFPAIFVFLRILQSPLCCFKVIPVINGLLRKLRRG